MESFQIIEYRKICIKYVIFDFKFYKFDMLDRISLILNKTIYL